MSIESNINKPAENSKNEKRKVSMDDYNFLGDLLIKTKDKNEKSVRQIALRLGVDKATVAKWQTGDTLPTIDKLPAIAEAYDANLEELTEAFRIAKEAHDLEKNARKSKTIFRKINPDSDVYGLPGEANKGRKVLPRKF